MDWIEILWQRSSQLIWILVIANSANYYCNCIIFSLHIHTYRIIYRIIYIHRMSRDIVELIVAETSRLSACSKAPTCSWWLSSRPTALHVITRAHCILAHLRSLYIICMRIETCDILNMWKEKGRRWMKFLRTLLGIIKRHIECGRYRPLCI